MVQTGFLLQHSNILPVNGVVVAPRVLGQCRVCTISRFHSFLMFFHSLSQTSACLTYISGSALSTWNLIHHFCQLFRRDAILRSHQ